MRISLEEFIRGGPFGAINVGMTRADVEEAFGTPVEWEEDVISYQKANIWIYDGVQLYFQNEKLWMIFLDEFEVSGASAGPEGAEQLEVDMWGLTAQHTRSQIEEKLKAANIEYQTEPFAYNENGILLVTKAKTVLALNGKAGEEPKLQVIHRRMKL